MYDVITAFVAGVRYGNRQAAICKVEVDDPLWLCREPENQDDPNAILVLRQTEDLEEIGYLPRELAAVYAPILDAAEGVCPAWVVSFRREGQGRSLWGVQIGFKHSLAFGEPTFTEANEKAAVPA